MNDPYSFEAHLKSVHEKRVWWWPCKWYIKPGALSMGGWEEHDVYFKKHYPVQRFIRDIIPLYTHVYFTQPLRHLKYTVKGWIRNPRKKMRDKLFPIWWQDLTETITQFHIQTIIEFVDREECFKYNDYDFTPEHAAFAIELKKWHEYATVKRPALEAAKDAAYDKGVKDGTFEDIMEKVREIDEQITTEDTNLCMFVILNRIRFWV